MADLDEFIHKYFEENIKKDKTVLECIDLGIGGQQCVEVFGDNDIKDKLKEYYQNNQLDEGSIVALEAIKQQVTKLFNALKIIKQAAKSDSVKDFCDNYFDTFLSPNEDAKEKYATAIKEYAISQYSADANTEKKIVSMIYAIMKYYKENGTTN